MARLIIRNIGPIKNVDIELNKVNVFIGEQSSGKSTIAKIISFCSWLEKNANKDDVLFTNGKEASVACSLIITFCLILERIHLSVISVIMLPMPIIDLLMSQCLAQLGNHLMLSIFQKRKSLCSLLPRSLILR